MRQGNSIQGTERNRRETVALKRIQEAIQAVQYGTITILVQDGIVIQIDRTEKMRLNYADENSLQDGSGI